MESLPGPIDPQTGGFGNLFDLSSEEMDDFIDKAPKQHQFFFNSMKRLTEYEKGILRAGEYSYAGQVGEKAYLWYLYRQTSARYEIARPVPAMKSSFRKPTRTKWRCSTPGR